MDMFFIALGLLLLGGIFPFFVNDNSKIKICSYFAGLSTVVFVLYSILVLLTGKPIIANIYLSSLFGNVNFVIDALSAFFILIISVMSFIGIIYANGYLKSYIGKNKFNISVHCFFLMLLIASMIGVVTVQNSLLFLILWEIMSLSSFFLVIFESDKKEVISSGIKYLIYMHLSVIFIILAFALLNIYSGSLNFMDFSELLSKNKHFSNIVFLLAFTGFGIKAGFFPFHNWLPDAHPAAPSHVSGIMSGVMIKTGIYGILRILYLISIPSKLMAYTVLIIALLSSMYGVLYAITQHDIKRLLAYHSIENIGIIGIGIGIGLIGIVYNNPVAAVLGFSGGLLHILNHSIFKELLFFSAGSVYKQTHTRNIEYLGGIIKNMPYSSLLFAIGSIAISGLPPFNGFISELLIYGAMISGLPAPNTTVFITIIVSLASLAIVGTMAILCFTKAFGVMFLGSPRSEQAANVQNDVEKIMIIPMVILAFFALIIGIFPQYAASLVLSPVSLFIQGEIIINVFAILIQLLSYISLLFFVFILIILIITGLKFFISKKSRQYSTWGCGYDKPNNHMQYTASSYADLFVSTLKPMFKRIAHIKKPKELFPKDAYYEVEIEDIEEAYIVKPLLKFDEKILSKFEKIQNGNIQQYILFGLIFLLIAIIGLKYFG
ncbi:hypothetical protein IJG14_07525 [bacterium]|nr:hypothetical protein [bacterium]